MPAAVTSDVRGGYADPDIGSRSLQYDDAVADFLEDLPLGDEQQQDQNAPVQTFREEDQEVQVKRQRKPIPKLDEERLLSIGGIPRLRKIAKTRMKFRGKGHEFSDISRLLNTYQLWLDDLYPRAKFRDGLTMVEKVGHSKRMQIMRKAWLDETKPHRRELTPDPVLQNDGVAAANSTEDVHMSLFGEDEDAVGEVSAAASNRQPPAQHRGPFEHDDDPDEDELDALLASEAQGQTRGALTQQSATRPSDNDDEPNEDELDALLAENADFRPSIPASTARPRGPFEDDSEDDDLDALLPEQSNKDKAAAAGSKTNGHDGEDFAAEEEAMAAMGDDW